MIGPDCICYPGFADDDFVSPDRSVIAKPERVRNAFEPRELSPDEEEAIIETRRQRRADRDADAKEFD